MFGVAKALLIMVLVVVVQTVVDPVRWTQERLIGQLSAADRLLDAAADGDVRALRAAIRDGASPETRGAAAASPLVHATINGHSAAIEALLDAGAGVDTPDMHGYTALDRAVTGGRANVVALLLDRGADVHRLTPTGMSKLQLAAGSGSTATLATVLRAGRFDRRDVDLAMITARADGHHGNVAMLFWAGIATPAWLEAGSR